MRAAIVVAVTLLTVSGQYRPAAAVVAAPNAVATQASPLWDAPVGGARPDLFAGPWGNGSAPDPAAVYTFIRNKQGGANPGVVVRDPHGRVWHVKQAPSSGDRGDEGPVEVVLSRVLSAIGYHQPPVYYVRSFTMRDGKRVHQEPGGRFRLNEASLHDRGPWSWRESSIVGTRPYNGLLFVLLVFNSWDLKDSNNRIYDVRQNDGVTSTWYVVRDLGGALGESGTLRPKRNNIETFEEERFIKGISHGFVDFAYDGKRPELFHHQVTVDDLRWATGLLAGLSDREWRDAFRAGAYSPEQSARFIRKIHDNLLQAQRLGGAEMPIAQGKR